MGHLMLARSVVSQQKADEVWLMVSPQNPLKEVRGLLSEKIRMRLAQKALEGIPHLCASDLECRLPRPSYTYLTLRALRSTYPDTLFSLLIGADNWLSFNRWVHTDEILANHPIYIYPRPEYIVDEPSLPQGVCLLDSPLCPFSSTDIRHRIANGEDVSEMLPASVLEIIKKEKLYGCGV